MMRTATAGMVARACPDVEFCMVPFAVADGIDVCGTGREAMTRPKGRN
jgi:hypothetical protein